MDITELLEWLTGGPNFGPFAGLQPFVRSIFGLVLGAGGVIALFFLIRGTWRYIVAGSNVPKKNVAIDDWKHGGVTLLLVFGLGVALAIVSGVAGTIL